MQKLTGEKYVLTNRSVQKAAALGIRLLAQVPLAEIDEVGVQQESGQEFYKAADLYLMNKAGATLMVLEGVPHPYVFRQTILEARDAHNQVGASLATINARHAAAR
jgi:hypothetical protein